MKLKYMIPALCICTCTAMPEMLHAQDDSLKKDSTERPFNAMDYVLQKRYIPQGREVNNSQPGKNFSLSVMGGVNKLRGSSSLPAWFNGGIALTKDVSSFNSYRVSLLGGFNDELKQGGIELDHLFNLSDYIGGLAGTLSSVEKLGLVCGTQTIPLYRRNRRCGLPQTV